MVDDEASGRVLLLPRPDAPFWGMIDARFRSEPA